MIDEYCGHHRLALDEDISPFVEHPVGHLQFYSKYPLLFPMGFWTIKKP